MSQLAAPYRSDFFQVWVLSARPKTLVAACAPVFIASSLCFARGSFSLATATVILLTALLIQVATNFANDAVDSAKGSDDETRVGPLRAVHNGLLGSQALWRATVLCLALATAMGSYLVAIGGWPILLIGISALLFAVLYSATPLALSYSGTADVFVLLYFGPISSAGTEYILSGTTTLPGILAGLACGCLSSAILVVNNLRDIEQDTRAEKKTLTVRFGARFARRQYTLLLLTPALLVLYLLLATECNRAIVFSLFYLAPALVAIRLVMAGAQAEALNEILELTGKILFVFALLFSLGVLS